jgi:uncharacterized membrane protein YqaE (UPF0057 family)
MFRTVVGILLAPLFPPAAVWVACGIGPQLRVSSMLAVVGYLVFQFLYAGPGLIIWGLGICHALVCAVRSAWYRPLNYPE